MGLFWTLIYSKQSYSAHACLQPQCIDLCRQLRSMGGSHGLSFLELVSRRWVQVISSGGCKPVRVGCGSALCSRSPFDLLTCFSSSGCNPVRVGCGSVLCSRSLLD